MNYNMLWLLRFDLTDIFFNSCIYQMKFKKMFFFLKLYALYGIKNVVPLLKMKLDLLTEK